MVCISVAPVSVYLNSANPIKYLIAPGRKIEDISRTSVSWHAVGVRMWLKGTTEWSGGWGVCMSVWVGIGATLRM